MSQIEKYKAKVLQAETQLLQAIKKSDLKSLEELLHDDLLFMLSTGEVITKEMDLETYRSGNLELEEIVSEVDSVNIIGENAVVSLTSRIRGKIVQESFEGQFRYMRVWKIFEELPKVIAGSCIQI